MIPTLREREKEMTPDWQNYELVIICFCDLQVKEHEILNNNFIESAKNTYNTKICDCSGYLSGPKLIEEITSNQHSQYGTKKVISIRKVFQYLLRLLKRCKYARILAGKKPVKTRKQPWTYTKGLDFWSSVNIALKLLRTKNSDLCNFAFRGVEIGRHLCIDSSLIFKIPFRKLDPKQYFIEWIYLKVKTFYICELLRNVSQTTNLIEDKSKILVISSNVYALDWSIRGWCNQTGVNHVFIQHSPQLRAYCQMAKAYKSNPHDVFNRRNHQEVSSGSKKEIIEAYKFAESYLEHRLSQNSFHRYSPLEMDLSIGLRVLEKLSNDSTELWSYFCKSPDELISIEHAVNESGMRCEFKYLNSGVAQNEYECINLLASEAAKSNAVLVIRIHPRLGRNNRESQISPELQSMMKACIDAKNINESTIIIEPEKKVNSYELAIWSDKVFSFRGSMPIEVSLTGIKPLVIARNKSTMNYTIKKHADAAPNNINDLSNYLGESCPSRYTLEEIAEVTWQFWVMQAKNCQSFTKEVSPADFKKFLSSSDRFYDSKDQQFKDKHANASTRNEENFDDMTVNHLEKIYKILKNASC